jgi:hypothetical protein
LKNNKVVISLVGGLGNQMFQYAFASIIAKKNNTKLLIDTTFFKTNNKNTSSIARDFGLDIFNLHLKEYKKTFYKRLIYKLKPLKRYNEPSLNFNNEALNLKSPIYISGYFQSYKYFLGFEDFIKDLFTFPKNNIGVKNENILKKIKFEDSISIHIRRGDYINNKKTNQVHGTCSLDYYLSAIKRITKNENKKYSIYFFSDDINWVRKKFKDLNFDKEFIDHNTGNKSWIDIFLMSNCKHNIISNSSFSYWAGWLNNNPNKTVIAPKQWFVDPVLESQTKDLIPKLWIRL